MSPRGAASSCAHGRHCDLSAEELRASSLPPSSHAHALGARGPVLGYATECGRHPALSTAGSQVADRPFRRGQRSTAAAALARATVPKRSGCLVYEECEHVVQDQLAPC